MTTDQHAANTANAQLSTGPRTDEGKARSSQNSLKHGVFAKTIVLPGESQEEFDALLAGLRKDHKPEGETESNLVRGLAEIQWRLNRLRRYEAAATADALESDNLESPDFGTKALLNCTLIEQRLLRAFQTTLKLLKEAQTPRLEKRERDLRMAADLRRLHRQINMPWHPESDGFVFSIYEIDQYIRVHQNLAGAALQLKRPFYHEKKAA